MKKFLFGLACIAGIAAADVDINKVHIVDTVGSGSSPKAMLFRGNTPLTDADVVDYDQWYGVLVDVARNQIGATVAPKSQLYLIDVGFEDAADVSALAEFWKNPANAAKGRYYPWDMNANSDYPPTFNTTAQIAYVSNSTVWSLNKIPERVTAVFKMLIEGPPAGYTQLAIYSHCGSGWNKVGTFIDTYRISHYKRISASARAGGLQVIFSPPALKSETTTLSNIFSVGCKEGGRCPVKAFTSTVGWYCIWSNAFELTTYTDCTTAYICDEQSTCQPTVQ